jgi:AcrR family transcriptional regulator
VIEEGSAELGWRERKKQATRDALGSAALKLALKVGPENVRVDDIAAAAGVSPRTFNNYFSSREEAICALRNERTARIVDALRARPADEPLDAALIGAIMETTSRDGGRLTPEVNPDPDKATIRLIATAPAIRGEYMRSMVAIEIGLAEVIAERTGGRLGRDIGPRLIAASVASAFRVAGEYWFRSDDDRPFTEFLREALELVAPIARGYQPTSSAADQPSVNPLRESPAC